jgi:hypothetical protein
MTLKADPLSIKHWMYPLNKPRRDYQFNIVKHSLFENTLVALPTGLGKTFIAGVVMLNCQFALSFILDFEASSPQSNHKLTEMNRLQLVSGG